MTLYILLFEKYGQQKNIKYKKKLYLRGKNGFQS